MTEPATPFAVGEIVATSVDALLSAAALNLGDALPDGRKLAKPDPLEAWLALLAASGILAQLKPVMADEFRRPFEQLLVQLLDRFKRQHGDLQVPTGGIPAL